MQLNAFREPEKVLPRCDIGTAYCLYSLENILPPGFIFCDHIREITSEFLQLRWPSSNSIRLWRCRIGFDYESGQTNDFKTGIHRASLLDV